MAEEYPDTHPVQLSDGRTLYVPNKYGEEETRRLQNEANTAIERNKANVVPTGDTATNEPFNVVPTPDPSKSDDWGTYIDKQIRAGIRGTAMGGAAMGDVLATAGNVLLDDYKSATGQPTSKGGWISPVSDWMNDIAAPVPEGSDYKSTHDWASIVGPVLATELISGGRATPEAMEMVAGRGLARKAAEAGKELIAKPALKTAGITGAGVTGARVGGGVGEMVGGEGGKRLGEVLGSVALPAGAMPLIKTLASKALTVPESVERLKMFDRFNQNLPEGQRTTPTLGHLGSRPAGSLTDVTARGWFSGGPAFRTRADLFRALEQSFINDFEFSRGVGSGVRDPATGSVPKSTITPEPSRGQISRETIGGELAGASQKALPKAEALLSKIQDELVARVGPRTPVDPSYFYDAVAQVAKDPELTDATLLDYAKEAVAAFERNMSQVDPVTGQPLIDVNGNPFRLDPNFAQVSKRRSLMGRQIASGENRPLPTAIIKSGYRGATEGMRDAAESQGVPAAEFDATQEQTGQLYDDIASFEKTIEAPHAGGAFDTLFTGSGRQSLEPLEPLARHNPADLSRVLANLLDWRTRGAGRAGISTPDPTRFDIKGPEEAIQRADPDYLRTATGDVPEVMQSVSDAAELAYLDSIRPGKRSVPGGVGSTIGQFAVPGIGSLLGAATGALSHGGGGVGSAVLGGLGALAGGLGTEVGNLGLGKLLTNEKFTRAMINPQVSLPLMLARGVQGLQSGSADIAQREKAAAEKARQDEMFERVWRP